MFYFGETILGHLLLLAAQTGGTAYLVIKITRITV